MCKNHVLSTRRPWNERLLRFRTKAWYLLLYNLDVVLFLKQGNDVSRVCDMHLGRLAFHLSISSCCLLYCLTNSSSTFFKPSEFVCNAGVTSLTVLSTSTPFIIRKHLRSGDNGSRVSRTSLWGGMSGEVLKKALGHGVLRCFARVPSKVW